MKIKLSQLKRAIRKVIVESDQWKGILPEELWSISDYEDAVDTGMLSRLQDYSDEHLQMKIEQLREEIMEEKGYLDDPQNQYDTSIAPKESLIHVIQGILDGLPPSGV